MCRVRVTVLLRMVQKDIKSGGRLFRVAVFLYTMLLLVGHRSNNDLALKAPLTLTHAEICFFYCGYGFVT